MLNKNLYLALSTSKNAVANINFRNTYITAVIKELQGNGKYKIQILGSDKEYPDVYANDPNIEYAVNDRVGILCEYGCKEKLIIVGKLDEIIEEEVTSGVNSLG
jgi:hypothetical protein